MKNVFTVDNRKKYNIMIFGETNCYLIIDSYVDFAIKFPNKLHNETK